ncbi:MAG: DNA polymerase III subunit chi [Sphingobium sp.]
MQVDFYQLSRDPVENVVPTIAVRLLENGARLLIVEGREEMRERLSTALWAAQPESFLAHGHAGGDADAAQPILLSADCAAHNGAGNIALTDGIWRDEALGFERAFYFFNAESIDTARASWRALKANDSVEPRFWKQEGRRWVQGP